MKNFEKETAKELLFKIEFFYTDSEKGTLPQQISAKNSMRAYLDTAAVLFNLQGYSRIEIEDELKKIIG